MEIIWIEEADSTNNYLKERVGALPHPVMVAAKRQTAGRGQRGNSWEAAPGLNLTFSILIRPEGIKARDQFAISELTALAMVSTLRDFGIQAKIKWPNDIYVADRKICGILIENSILGDSISHSVIGVGLNVNQDIFLSDAPNPVSMRNITGKAYDLPSVGLRVRHNFLKFLQRVSNPGDLHKEFKEILWRNDGLRHKYLDAASRKEFMAEIADVEPDGHLLLKADDCIRRYAFKEVVAIL